MPKSFDPALASAPPETDIVRAVYEGLTETDAKTLQAVPAIATEWKHSADFKTWTFILRKDARWSNGERVTAKDFARSWKRLAIMGEKVSHQELLRNIVGWKSAGAKTALQAEEKNAEVFSDSSEQALNNQANSNSTVAATPQTAPSSVTAETQTEQETAVVKPLETKFGVEATDNFTLVISLVRPDKDFPALVAHPIFRPIFGDGKKLKRIN